MLMNPADKYKNVNRQSVNHQQQLQRVRPSSCQIRKFPPKKYCHQKIAPRSIVATPHRESKSYTELAARAAHCFNSRLARVKRAPTRSSVSDRQPGTYALDLSQNCNDFTIDRSADSDPIRKFVMNRSKWNSMTYPRSLS